MSAEESTVEGPLFFRAKTNTTGWELSTFRSKPATEPVTRRSADGAAAVAEETSVPAATPPPRSSTTMTVMTFDVMVCMATASGWYVRLTVDDPRGRPRVAAHRQAAPGRAARQDHVGWFRLTQVEGRACCVSEV